MQQFIVILIVGIAACSVARRYAPASAKRGCRLFCARLLRRAGWIDASQELEAVLVEDASCGDGGNNCGGCGGCGAAPTVQVGKPKMEHTVSLDGLRRDSRRQR